MAIELSQDDVTYAEEFLASLLDEEVENGKFGKGTALRDLVVKAMAHVFAHLQKENEEIRSMQSLLSVANIATGDPDTDRAVTSATDALMSNWFITRNSGNFARGAVVINVNTRQDYLIPGNNRFIYNRTLAFYPDVVDPSQSIVIRESELLPLIALDGTVEAYQFRLNVVAAKTGQVYNVPPATWEGGGQFSPYVTGLFSTTTFDGGQGRETTTDIVDRASTAISVRNLINPRSIEATLSDRYPSINRMFITGMGDVEMLRDLKSITQSGVELHVGGHFDIYCELPRIENTAEGTLGGIFTRPDGIINIFRDSNIVDWTAEAIQAGDVLRVTEGLPDTPRDFVIKEILADELRISEQVPFAAATDEDGTLLEYYIYRPIFGADTQVLPATSVNVNGQSSRQISNVNRMMIPGGPHYEIIDVSVITPDAADPFTSATDGYVHFPNRVNRTPQVVQTSDALEYQIISNDAGLGQSMLQMEELVLATGYEDKQVRITYETLTGLDTIHTYTRDRFERVLAGNVLAKGFIPVYLTVNVPYRLKPNATGTVDEDGLVQALVDLVNNFDPNDIIDVSDFSQETRNYDGNIGAVLPHDIMYELIVPDGRIIEFTTTDEVRIDPILITDTRDNSSLEDPSAVGISDRNVRYMTTSTRITVEDRT